MRVKKYLALTLAAVLATTMLTACPWEKEEDETDDASSVPVTSTDTSQDDGDHCIKDTGYQYKLENGKPVLVADNSNNPELPGLTQKVLDVARAVGL